jgi:preprotein translocase subunit SecG
MQTLLLIAELLIAIALVVVVLLQKSEGGALGIGGGGGSGLGGLFSPRGAADTLTRTTTILGILFFLVCMGLNLLELHGRNEKSILDSSAPAPAAVHHAPAPPAPVHGPAVPKPR